MAYPALSARSKNWGTEILTDTDLESELDLLHDYVNAALDSSSGHKHDGTTSEGPKILTANIDDAAGTAGDIFQNTSGTTISRLAIGTANQVLAVNSGATAVEYQTVSGDQTVDGSIVQVVNVMDGVKSSGTTVIPEDTSTPQITEGDQVMSLAITPASTNNKLKIDVVVHADPGAGTLIAALFNTDFHATNAMATSYHKTSGVTPTNLSFVWYGAAPIAGATTYTVRIGSSSGTTTFNGEADAGEFNSTLASSITIMEIKGS